jgi:gas vesicle protein
MSQEYGWTETPGSSGPFFRGLLAGTLIGGGLGILFAPWRGTELRGQMADSAASAGETVSRAVDEWTDRGRNAYQRARHVASRVGDEVNRVAGDAAKSVEKRFNAAGDTASAAAQRADAGV